MNIQCIYKGLFLTLLFLIISIQVSAQCSINLTIKTKNATCGDDGAVEAIISNLSDLSDNPAYEVKKTDGTLVTPAGAVSPLITGLGKGSYTLTVKGFCKTGGTPATQSIPFTIVQGTNSGGFKAELNTGKGKYRYTSLNNINTGKIAFDIKGGSGQYILELINPPATYKGQTTFIVTSPGTFSVDELSPGTYKIKISDGDCDDNIIIFTQLIIKAVSNHDDLPADLSELFNNTTQYVYPRAGTSYPSEEYKKLRFDLFTSLKEQGIATQTAPGQPTNLNDYYNREDAQKHYEFGLAYGTDASQVTTWTPLKPSYSYYFDDAIYPYSSLIKNDFSNFIPNLFIRLKNKPTISKVYTNYIWRTLSNQKEVRLTQNGFQIKIPLAMNRWWSLPYQLVGYRMTNGSVIETKKIKVDTSDPQMTTPIIDLDWNTGRWELYLEGLSPGNTDYKLSVGWVHLDTKQNFLDNLSASPMVQMDANVRPGYGNMYLGLTLNPYYGHMNSTSEFIFPKLKVTLDPNPNFPNGIGPTYTVTDTRMVPLTNSKYLPVAENNYKATVEMYDVNNNLAATKVLEGNQAIKIPDRGTMVATPGASLSINHFLADECYSRKISLDLDNIKSLFEMRLKNSVTNPVQNVRIQIFKMRSDGINADAATRVMTSNFSFKNPTTTSSAYNFSTNNLNSSAVEWVANTDKNKLEFIISETGNFVVVATPIFSSSYLSPGASIGSLWLNSLMGWYSIINDPYCHVKSSFTIEDNDLRKVRFIQEKTNGFRCNPTTIGTLNIGVESTSISDPKYTIRSVDKFGVLTGVYDKDIAPTNDKTFTWNDVPVGVEYIKITTETDDCINSPTSYTVQMYSLDNPTYLSSEGGYECINGTTTHTPTDLKLKAVTILGTTFQWYYPDDTKVPDSFGGNTANATIPVASIQLGNYKCVVTNPLCGGTVYTHQIRITDLGGDTFYWAVNATNSNWNDPANWHTWTGEVAPRIPDACTDVVIPGKVTSHYPDLATGSTTGTAVCRTIIFRYGGQVYHTEKLTYAGAEIEYNANYYSTLPTDDSTPTQPATNDDEGIHPEGSGAAISGLPTMTRNRWWMIAAPLKDMVTGDFQLDGKPNTFSAVYNSKKNEYKNYVYKGEDADKEYISVVNDNNMKLAEKNNAMLVWIPAFTLAKGGEQDALQASTGKITYPTTNSTFKEYDMRTLAFDGATNTITRTAPNRFIYENASNQPGIQYQLQIKADADRVDGLVLIGNPFMGTINFQSFYAVNSSLIENTFKILTNTGWVNVTAGAPDAHIAPLQGFVIKLKNPAAVAMLNFPYANIYSTMPIGSQVKPK